MKTQIHLLKSTKFLPLFITQFFGAFNDNAFKNAFLIWVTYDIAQKLQINTHIIITIASGLFILPFFLFSSLAGSLSDKFEKSKLVKIIKIFEILIVSSSFIGFYFENIYILLCITFLIGTQSTFFGPIKYSLLPEHLEKDELIIGNSLIELGTFLAILFGTIIGGIVIRLPNGIIIISTIVVLAAIIGYISSRFIPKTKINDINLKINFNIFTQTWRIIKYARKNNIVWFSIIGISWFWLIGFTLLSQLPIYTKNIINGNEFVITFFLTIFSIGIGIGSTMCNKLLKGKISGKIIPFGSIGISIGILLFCISSQFYQHSNNIINIKEFLTNDYIGYFISFSLLIIAISSGIYVVPLYAIMQHRSDKKYLSRIIATTNILGALFMVTSSFIIIILSKLNITLIEIFFIIAFTNILVLFSIKQKIK